MKYHLGLELKPGVLERLPYRFSLGATPFYSFLSFLKGKPKSRLKWITCVATRKDYVIPGEKTPHRVLNI